MPIIVTIDGPAGAGKTSASRGLANRLGYRFLDTGAMYRAVTLAALRKQIAWGDTGALAKIAAELEIKLENDRVLMNGEDVTQAIRTFEVTTHTRYAADNRTVRHHLVQLQRAMAQDENLVAEGRDQATVVFPKAQCKFFLTASDAVRAQRRYEELIARGEQVTLDEVIQKQQQRDERDLAREYGGLRKAEDSIEVSTDGLSTEQVIDHLESMVHARVGR